MPSSLRPVLLAALSLVLVGCAGSGAEDRLRRLEAQERNGVVMDLRLGHVEDRLDAVEAAVGELRAALQEKPRAGRAAHAAASPPPKTGSPPPAAPAASPPPKSAAISTAAPAGPAGGAPSTAPGPLPEHYQTLAGGRRIAPQAAPARPDPGRRPTAGGSQADYDAALALYEGRKPAAAQEAFLAFLELHPGSPLVPNALYWLGESYYAADKLDLAIMQFKRVAEAYPRHDKAAAALLKAGYAYARLNDKENARFYWQILLDDFPDSAPAALARKRLAGI